MNFQDLASRSSGKLPFFCFLFVARLVLSHGFEEKFTHGSQAFASAVLEPLDWCRRSVESVVGSQAIKICVESAVLYLDSLFGPENVYSFAMREREKQFVKMVLDFVAEGAASGLNVIAVYVNEILRATGMSHAIAIPHFTAEGVSAVISWALLALISYWMLFYLLRITVMLVRRMFWLIKVIVVLWLFIRIVNDPMVSSEVTTMRLTLIVFICAVFGVATSSGARENSLESRIRRLEARISGIDEGKSE
ncbi:hypothetical protein DNTS_014649 [Danionella cerebrum]|uniref:Uncharacterized protein n=1 Tax=Danionella cerebrum TaxID=2873325 RepID=A0A553Q1T8_9TELE|nr:hypothetical protein DNTS_014649 [Danionella translucida]